MVWRIGSIRDSLERDKLGGPVVGREVLGVGVGFFGDRE